VANVENLMAGGTDEKPSNLVAIAFHHGMKAVFVTAEGA
jgi:hypothetical protein